MPESGVRRGIALGAAILLAAMALAAVPGAGQGAGLAALLPPDAAFTGFRVRRNSEQRVADCRVVDLEAVNPAARTCVFLAVTVHASVEAVSRSVRSPGRSARGPLPEGSATGEPLGDEVRSSGSSLRKPGPTLTLVARKGRCLVELTWMHSLERKGAVERVMTEAEMRLAEKLVRDCFRRAQAQGFIP
jgi:hypothetical protein